MTYSAEGGHRGSSFYVFNGSGWCLDHLILTIYATRGEIGINREISRSGGAASERAILDPVEIVSRSSKML